MIYQQGDVIFELMEPDSKAEGKERNSDILFTGESTGHAHRTRGEVRIVEALLALYLVAPKGCLVVHEEHNQIELPPGNYKVRKVQEYDHIEGMMRQVYD